MYIDKKTHLTSILIDSILKSYLVYNDDIDSFANAKQDVYDDIMIAMEIEEFLNIEITDDFPEIMGTTFEKITIQEFKDYIMMLKNLLSFNEISLLMEKFSQKSVVYGVNAIEFNDSKFQYHIKGKYYYTFFRFEGKLIVYIFEYDNNKDTNNSFHYSIFSGEDENDWNKGKLWSNTHSSGRTNMIALFNVLLYITNQFLSKHPEVKTIQFFGEPNSKQESLYSFIVAKKKSELEDNGFKYDGSITTSDGKEIHKFNVIK